MSSKLDEKVGKYIDDYKSKVGEELDLDLLRKITADLGPSIYNRDAETISASDDQELKTLKNNFLVKKLGLEDDSSLMADINQVIEKYGKSHRQKYRAVVYYMLCKHFDKEDVYK